MNRRLILIPFVFLVFVIFSSMYTPDSGQEIIKISEDLFVHPLEKDIWRIEHFFPWSANAMLVRMGAQDFVLVDTPQDHSGTRDLLKWMKKTFKKKFRLTVINTHFHTDCLGGNKILADEGYTTVGSDKIPPLLEALGETMRRRNIDYLVSKNDARLNRFIEGYAEIELTPPLIAEKIEDTFFYYVASQPVELYFPGAGHSVDNIVVYFPRQQILFGGCLIKALEARSLGNVSDGDVAAWPSSVQKVIDRYPGARLVIPGHGPTGDKSLLKHTLDMLQNQQ